MIFILILAANSGVFRPLFTGDEVQCSARARDKEIWIKSGEQWEPLEIRGVNFSAVKPGAFPGEGHITADEYQRWFEQMDALGINTIRVNSLMPEKFYDAIKDFNEKHRIDFIDI